MKNIPPVTKNRILASAQKVASASPAAVKSRRVQSEFDGSGTRATYFQFEKDTFDCLKRIKLKIVAATGEYPNNKEVVVLALAAFEKNYPGAVSI